VHNGVHGGLNCEVEVK